MIFDQSMNPFEIDQVPWLWASYHPAPGGPHTGQGPGTGGSGAEPSEAFLEIGIYADQLTELDLGIYTIDYYA